MSITVPSLLSLTSPVLYHMILWNRQFIYGATETKGSNLLKFLQLESDGSDSHIFLEKGKAIQFKNLYTHILEVEFKVFLVILSNQS